MPHYIIPDKGALEEVQAKARTAGVPLLTPKTVRDYILGAHEHPVAIFSVSARDLLIFNRFASTLLTESPTVVTGAPGPLYASDWMTSAAAYYAISWEELDKQLSKSGLISSNPDQLEKRGRGIPADDHESSALDQLRDRHHRRDEPSFDDLVDPADVGS